MKIVHNMEIIRGVKYCCKGMEANSLYNYGTGQYSHLISIAPRGIFFNADLVDDHLLDEFDMKEDMEQHEIKFCPFCGEEIEFNVI